MKTSQIALRLTPVAVAVAVAMALMSQSVYAEDDEVTALTQPTNTVEIGVVHVSQDAAKFGEYTGLNKAGTSMVGNVDLRGGRAYSDRENGGTQRWSIKANDLGLTSRALNATTSEQGEWSLGLSYDELRHNLSNGYQTPYQGTMGGNLYTLPTGFGLVTTTGTGAPGTNALTTAQQAAFQNMDIATTRKNTSLNAGMNINSRLSLNFDFNHLDQSGAKLMAFGASGVGGVNGEVVSILPMPTNYKTDTVNLALHWRSDHAHLSVGYLGSFFRNGIDRINFQAFSGTPATGGTLPMQVMSTAPNNDFNQLNLSGGYALAPKTKLVGNLSYAHNTQNANFVAPEAGTMVTAMPVTSLNGKVVNTHADMKLIDQATTQLTLMGGFKYDERDNQTASNMYNFNAISGGNTANYPNTPLSNKKTQLELAGDYKIKPGQVLHAAYVHEDVNRWCNSYAVGTVTTPGNSGYYPAGTNCVVAKSSRDDRIDTSYRMKFTEDVDFKLSYGHSDRTTSNDPYAIAAFISQNGAVPGPVPATGNATIRGQNAGDFYGFYPYFDASRIQHAIKSSLNVQATEQLQLTFGGRYTYDKYASTYGVQNGNTWSLNLDAAYSYSDNGSLYAYATEQRRQRDLTDVQRYSTTVAAATATALSSPSTATWRNQLSDEDLTLGLGVKQAGLWGGKLELSADASHSVGKGVYSTALNYAGATTGGLTCSAAEILSCGQLPDIRSTMSQLKLTGAYQVDKKTKVILRYVYQHLASSDYYYNGYQYGTSPSGLMPTNQQAPNYNVNAVAATLLHTF
jgi:MtrB/PioB family decaheme-associated outer membrane protein